MVGLSDGKNIEDMCIRLDRILACDGRTDVQTSCHGTVRAMHTRRAVKTTLNGTIFNPKREVSFLPSQPPKNPLVGLEKLLTYLHFYYLLFIIL